MNQSPPITFFSLPTARSSRAVGPVVDRSPGVTTRACGASGPQQTPEAVAGTDQERCTRPLWRTGKRTGSPAKRVVVKGNRRDSFGTARTSATYNHRPAGAHPAGHPCLVNRALRAASTRSSLSRLRWPDIEGSETTASQHSCSASQRRHGALLTGHGSTVRTSTARISDMNLIAEEAFQ
jgi:hypothetical protein